jgi:hypothetical protein
MLVGENSLPEGQHVDVALAAGASMLIAVTTKADEPKSRLPRLPLLVSLLALVLLGTTCPTSAA